MLNDHICSSFSLCVTSPTHSGCILPSLLVGHGYSITLSTTLTQAWVRHTTPGEPTKTSDALPPRPQVFLMAVENPFRCHAEPEYPRKRGTLTSISPLRRRGPVYFSNRKQLSLITSENKGYFGAPGNYKRVGRHLSLPPILHSKQNG